MFSHIPRLEMNNKKPFFPNLQDTLSYDYYLIALKEVS